MIGNPPQIAHSFKIRFDSGQFRMYSTSFLQCFNRKWRIFLNNFHTDAFGGFLEMYDELNDSFGRNCEIKFSLTLKNSDAKKSKTHETAYRFNSHANNYVWLNFIQRTDFSKNFSGFVVKGYVEIVLTMIWVNASEEEANQFMIEHSLSDFGNDFDHVFINPKYPLGIHNQGATCYINSILQCLFHIPLVRWFILNFPPTSDRIMTELTKIFYHLEIKKPNVTTSELTKAFGWDEQDVRAQQDAMEFYTELFRHLEEILKILEGSNTNGFTVSDLKKHASSSSSSSSFPLPSLLPSASPSSDAPSSSPPTPPLLSLSWLYRHFISSTLRIRQLNVYRPQDKAIKFLSAHVENLQYITVYPKNASSLDEALKQVFGVEPNLPLVCGDQGTHHCYKTSCMLSPPPVLSIMISRFEYEKVAPATASTANTTTTTTAVSGTTAVAVVAATDAAVTGGGAVGIDVKGDGKDMDGTAAGALSGVVGGGASAGASVGVEVVMRKNNRHFTFPQVVDLTPYVWEGVVEENKGWDWSTQSFAHPKEYGYGRGNEDGRGEVDCGGKGKREEERGGKERKQKRLKKIEERKKRKNEKRENEKERKTGLEKETEEEEEEKRGEGGGEVVGDADESSFPSFSSSSSFCSSSFSLLSSHSRLSSSSSSSSSTVASLSLSS